MPFARPDLPTLMAQTETLLLGDLPQVSPVVRRLILRAIAHTQAGLVWSEHGYLSWLAEQLMPDMAERDYLARWATIFNVPTSGGGSGFQPGLNTKSSPTTLAISATTPAAWPT